MPKASVKRLIECKKDQLIDLVLDIEKYPEFVPFCLAAHVYERNNEGDLTLIIADLTIGKGPFKDTYKSDVKFNKKVFTKSGLMVGLGEDKDELIQVMDDLRSAEVDFLTIGQYLQPSTKHYPLDRYYTPKEFDDLGTIAKAKGFLLVSSSPLTRSSYHADEDFAKLQHSRNNFN